MTILYKTVVYTDVMGLLHDLGLQHGTDKAHYHGYLDFYETFLDRGSITRLLEIGVDNGYSLKMWRDWLPSDAHVDDSGIAKP